MMKTKELGFFLMMSAALTGCATFKLPQIGYDDERPAEPAALQGGRLLVVVADLRQPERGAAAECGGYRQNQAQPPSLHQPNSLDQLMACTNTPRGFFRSRSASCGVSKTTVRMAVHRSVDVRLAFS